MKKNVTIEMNNNSMVNVNVMATVIGAIAKYVDNTKEIFAIILEKIAAFYSKEIEQEITPAQAWLMIKTQAAGLSVLLTASYLPLCALSLVWFITSLLACKKAF